MELSADGRVAASASLSTVQRLWPPLKACAIDAERSTTNITVGTFSLDVTSTTSGAVVVNNDVTRVHTITYTCPTITSSAPGACPLQISLVNTGSIAITNVAVTWNTVGVPFQAIPMLNSYGPIAAGGHIDIPQAGIMWGQPLTSS